jgi:hypothetical protein
MEHRARLSHGRQELSAVEREIRGLMQPIKDGVSALSIKNELMALEARQAELKQHLEAPEMPQLLHPHDGWCLSGKGQDPLPCLGARGYPCRCNQRDSRADRSHTARAEGDRLKITLKARGGMLIAARFAFARDGASSLAPVESRRRIRRRLRHEQVSLIGALSDQ